MFHDLAAHRGAEGHAPPPRQLGLRPEVVDPQPCGACGSSHHVEVDEEGDVFFTGAAEDARRRRGPPIVWCPGPYLAPLGGAQVERGVGPVIDEPYLPVAIEPRGVGHEGDDARTGEVDAGTGHPRGARDYLGPVALQKALQSGNRPERRGRRPVPPATAAPRADDERGLRSASVWQNDPLVGETVEHLVGDHQAGRRPRTDHRSWAGERRPEPVHRGGPRDPLQSPSLAAP